MSLAFGFALPHWQAISGGAFSPASLFAGVNGIFYDISDLSTLFTTSAGTTQCAMPGLGSAVSVGRMLDKSGNGNHAIAFNDTTARPELRARVNLLTYSEDWTNAVWTGASDRASVTTTANAGTDPLGGNTATRLQGTASNWFQGQTIPLSALGSYILSVYVKSNTGSSQTFRLFGDGGTLTSSNQTATTDWQRFTFTYTATNITQQCFLIRDSSSNTVDLLIWGADLRPANIGANVPAYQRIADANTYDTAGFPLYLRFDGVDDSMYTPANLNLSGTDKVAVFAGVRKLSDAAAGIIAELSTNFTDGGGWYLVNDISPGRYEYSGRGNRVGVAGDAATAPIAGPDTSVLTAQQNINNNTPSTIRRNGALAGSSGSTTFGGGNFGTYPLFIGARNNSSIWFNGHLYSLIIAGSAVSAGNISATEQWVAGKTGIVI